MRPRPSAFRSTTAAAVSSQVVSMPRTIIGLLYGFSQSAVGAGGMRTRILNRDCCCMRLLMHVLSSKARLI